MEFQVRSSKFNCSEENPYMCFPNENLTELLEFCYHKSGIIGATKGKGDRRKYRKQNVAIV